MTAYPAANGPPDRDDTPEISDVIVSYDPQTLRRIPIPKTQALSAYPPNSRPFRIINAIPADPDGHLDPHHVDHLLVSAHNEMQRLWEEFRHGARVAKVLLSLVRSIRLLRPNQRIQIVDVGCGIGYVVRWLTAHRIFDQDIDIIGVDYNASLIAYAQQLAEIEGLPCRFHTANAFRLPETAQIYLSSGVLHHFRGPDLLAFFEQQAACQPLAFAHFDIQRSWLAPIGAGLFHHARMRIPLAQYDGTHSALRAHPISTLQRALTQGAPSYHPLHFNPLIPWFPLLRTMHAVLGIHPALLPHLQPFLDPTLFRDLRQTPHTPNKTRITPCF